MIAGITIAEKVGVLILEIIKMHEAGGPIDYNVLAGDLQPIIQLVENYWHRHHTDVATPPKT